MFLSSNIIHLREEQKMSATALSKILGKSKSAVASYESGKSYPPLDVLVLMHNLFKIDLETMVFLDLRKIPLIDIQKISESEGRNMILPEGKKGLKELLFDLETLVDKMKTAIREQEK